MPIENKDRFPEVDFLSDDKIRPIGDIGGTRLVILGKEQGTNAAVVSRSYSKPFDPDEEFFAVPLYELMSHTQEKINITEKLD